MIALPLCLAWTTTRETETGKLRVAPVLAAAALLAAFSIPMMRRPRLQPIRDVASLMSALSSQRPNQSIVIMIATDGPEYNIDTFMLAQGAWHDKLKRVSLDTVVYDAMNKRSAEDGFQRIDDSDYVLFLQPQIEPGADWARTYAAHYRQQCEQKGLLDSSVASREFDVFEIRKMNSPPHATRL
jgi:hypothetical protein